MENMTLNEVIKLVNKLDDCCPIICYRCKNKRNQIADYLKELKQLQEKPAVVLPRPYLCNALGDPVDEYLPCEWVDELNHAHYEVLRMSVNEEPSEDETDCLVRRLQQLITVCVSWQNALGYDEAKRSELAREVNINNESCGYFDENKIATWKKFMSAVDDEEKDENGRTLPKEGEIWQDYTGYRCKILNIFTDTNSWQDYVVFKWSVDNTPDVHEISTFMSKKDNGEYCFEKVEEDTKNGQD